MRRFVLILLALVPLAVSAQDLTIATIDFEAFLKNAHVLTSRYATLQQQIDEHNARFQAMVANIRKLESRIGMTDKSDPGYDTLVQDLESSKVRLQVDQRQTQERLEQSKEEKLQAAIADAVGLLEDYCREQDIGLVVQVGGLSEDREVPIANMPVLYARADLDITREFLAFANARRPAADADAEVADQPPGSVPVLEGLGEEQP